MIKDTYHLVKKNFKVLFRSKMSIFMLIVLPVLIIFLLGMAFNSSSTYNINIGVFAEKYKPLTNSLLQSLKDNDFRINILQNEQACINQIKEGVSNVCVVFPPDLEVKEGRTNNIIFHVDPSQINLVWKVLDIISSKLSVKSDEISLNLTSDLLHRLQNSKEEAERSGATVEQLKENNQKLMDINSDVTALLAAVTELASYDIDAVMAKWNADKAAVDALIASLQEKLPDMNEDVKTISSKANKVTSSGTEEGQTSPEDRIKELAASLAESFEALEKEVSAAKEQRTADSQQLEAMLAKIKENFAAVKKNAESLRAKAAAELELLDKQLQDIRLVETSFANIMATISNVGITQAGSIVNPITTTINPVVSQKSHLNYVFAGLIMLIIMFVSLLLSSTIVMIEKKSKSYLLNYMTPTSDFAFVFSTYLTIMVLMIVQSAIILSVASIFFKAQVVPNLGAISIVLLVATTTFVLAGMAVAYLFKSEEAVTLITVGIGNIFLLLSDIILPLESMPRYFQDIVSFNPLLISERLLKQALLFNSQLPTLTNALLWLVGYCAALFIIILIVEKLLKRHTLAKFLNWLVPFRKK